MPVFEMGIAVLTFAQSPISQLHHGGYAVQSVELKTVFFVPRFAIADNVFLNAVNQHHFAHPLKRCAVDAVLDD